MKVRLILIIYMFFASVGALGISSEFLSSKDFTKLKKEKCVFFHFWATWCLPCLEEVPQLLKILEQTPNIKPVVIDISSLGAQDKFSKKWVETILKPKFTTYRKPNEDQKRYLASADKKWNGTVPHSVFYSKGKIKKRWEGTLNLGTFKNELLKLCK